MPIRLNSLSGERRRRNVLFGSCARRFRSFPSLTLFAAVMLCAICTSCGAVGSSEGPPPPVTVTVTPASAQPFQGETVQFSAVVENASNSAVLWQVNQTSGGNSKVGTIDSSGLYTAPGTVPTPPTVTVTAVLQSDSTKMGNSSVTVQAFSSITSLSLAPKLSSVTTSQPLQLNVLTSGVTNSGVTWAVDGISNGSPAVGTISVSG